MEEKINKEYVSYVEAATMLGKSYQAIKDAVKYDNLTRHVPHKGKPNLIAKQVMLFVEKPQISKRHLTAKELEEWEAYQNMAESSQRKKVQEATLKLEMSDSNDNTETSLGIDPSLQQEGMPLSRLLYLASLGAKKEEEKGRGTPFFTHQEQQKHTKLPELSIAE